MVEDFITKETSDILYTKGFPNTLLMPTQALVQKWLREIHYTDIVIDCVVDDTKGANSPENRIYTSDIYTFKDIPESQREDKEFNSYEEALEDAIRLALTLL